MALIPNASNYLTKGINEAYGILSTGYNAPSASGGKTSALSAMVDKYKRDLANAARTAGGIYTAEASGDIPQKDYSTLDPNTTSAMPPKPNDLDKPAIVSGSGSGTSSNDSKVIAAIGRGWDDSGDVISDTSKSLSSSKNYINNLGKVRDQYLTSLDSYKNKTNEAIAGNKTLIGQNQKKDLDVLAGDTRKSIDNTNVMLGVKGASGGSASKQAARAISTSAGKLRAGVLTAYGDEDSKQNLAAKNAAEEYTTKRNQAYEWETTARQQAQDEYKAQESALKRLKSKESGWKDADIAAMSDKNLNNFMGSLNAIMTQARDFRTNLAAKMTEYGGLSDVLDVAAVGVDAPSELDTPVFNENIDLTDPTASDWYDPNKQPRRILKGYDALGNPIYVDEPVSEPAA